MSYIYSSSFQIPQYPSYDYNGGPGIGETFSQNNGGPGIGDTFSQNNGGPGIGETFSQNNGGPGTGGEPFSQNNEGQVVGDPLPQNSAGPFIGGPFSQNRMSFAGQNGWYDGLPDPYQAIFEPRPSNIAGLNRMSPALQNDMNSNFPSSMSEGFLSPGEHNPMAPTMQTGADYYRKPTIGRLL